MRDLVGEGAIDRLAGALVGASTFAFASSIGWP
jgi:hypothetical protein